MPYGNAGRAEKDRVLEQMLFSRPAPPFLYNDVLILVSSARMKRMYSRLFLDLAAQHGSSALVQPVIQTLHQFVEQHYARLPGPRLMDENSRLILFEGIVKERLTGRTLFDQSPDLLAPALSAALARTIEQLAGAGVAPDDLALKVRGAEFSDKPQVGLLIDVYARYEAALREQGLCDPAAMRSRLLREFDPAWLSPFRHIVIDDIQDTGKLEAAILRKIAECGNCTVLVDAPSGDLVHSAGEFHPLRITRDHLAALGASACTGDAGTDSDDQFLSRTLFSDRPAAELSPPSSFAKRLEVTSAVNTREEVSFIARRVKLSLQNNTVPETVLVAFPSLDSYGPLVEEIFTDYGIPYNRALGRQLSTSAVATAVVSLLRAFQEEYSGPSLLRVFSSPFLKFGDQPGLAPALDRLLRSQRMTGGRDKLLAALKHRVPAESTTDLLSAPLQDLFTALEPFSSAEPATLTQWMERLSGLIAWSGLAARVARIHGPLNINLQAMKKLDDTLASLGRAGSLFPGYTYTFHEWLFLLTKTFMRTRFQVPPEDEGGVQVLGIEESMGHAWSEVHLGGLVEGTFPQRLPQNIFLPEQVLEAMGVRTLESARLTAAFHFYRLVLSSDTVMLTWPESEGDRPALPSPFLAELKPLRDMGLIQGPVSVRSDPKLENSFSIPELAKALGIAGYPAGIASVLNADLPGMSAIRSAVMHASPPAARPIGPVKKTVFRVTELDDYLKCPYDYYVKHVLRLEPLEEATEDMTALDRGTIVHQVLRNFYLAWKQPVTAENRDEARHTLENLADSAFGKEADTVRNRREKDLFLQIMAERFLDAEEAFWRSGMRPAYLEHKIESFPISLSDGSTVLVTGKVDRIDRDVQGNFIIVDYKTGSYPAPVKGIDQEIYQLPIYAVMARSALGTGEQALLRPVGLAYYDLKGKNKGHARDVVLYDQDQGRELPAIKPLASPKSAGDFEAILAQSIVKTRKAIEGILSGDFTNTPRNTGVCRYCRSEMMCMTEDEE